jgi:hypothetical protein
MKMRRTLLGLLVKANPNHLMMQTDSVSETLCSFGIPDNRQTSGAQ